MNPTDAAVNHPMTSTSLEQAQARPAPVTRSRFTDEPYEFERCTITLTLQFWPDDGHAQGRRVLVSARNHLDAPLVCLAREHELGALPIVVKDVLDQLRSEMPERGHAHAEVETKRRADEAAAAERRQTAQKTKKGRAASKPSVAS